MSARSKAKPGLLDWIDHRIALREWVRRRILSARVPARGRAWQSIGFLLLLLFGLQLASGVLLLFHFSPHPDHAFASVTRIMREVPFGWLIRLAHVSAANLMVLLVFLHLFRSAFVGAYKEPRELTWITGCILFLLTLGLALSGYILPWSQLSYWATTVVSSSLEYLPLVGHALLRVLRGGDLVGPATFSRAFASHVVLLPLLLLIVLVVHLALIWRTGLAGPAQRKGSPPNPSATEPAFPGFALRVVATGVGLVMLIVALAVFWPDLFLPEESFQPANPLETPPAVKPAWYLLWAYQLPRMMPEALALLLQGIAVAGLFALPFLDRSPHRHPLDRPLVTLGIGLALLVLILLTVLGYRA
ncbi:MAG: cytochrome bc complex cytochrome b subunit [Myxococcota bacterium]